MNRREIRLTAQDAAKHAGKAAKLITLVFLLCRLGLYGLQYLAGFLADQPTTSRHLSDTLTAGARNLLISLTLALLLQLIGQLLFTGYARTALQIHRKQPLSMGDLLSGFQIPLRVIVLEVLRFLMLLIWGYAITIPVSFLLVVPMSTLNLSDENLMMLYAAAIIALTAITMLLVSYRYRGALFVLLDHPELTPWQCIRTAAAMTRGHRMELFLLDLSLLPWMLLCGLTAGILLIWKMPYFAAVYAGAYEELYRQYRELLQRARELRQQFPTRQNPPDQM